MNFTETLRRAVLMALMISCAGVGLAATRTWNVVAGDWFDSANWLEETVPAAGDQVVIGAGGTALLTNATPALTSLSVTGTLVFSNWNTTLSATNVMIASGGVMTCAGPFSAAQMSNNLVVVCSNLTVDAGGAINLDGRGYAGGIKTNAFPLGDGNGPGRGLLGFSYSSIYSSGAGHGGRGGPAGYGTDLRAAYITTDYPGARTHGNAAYPILPGSGGGGHSTRAGGDGGGAVRIAATGCVTVDGRISTDATEGAAGGSGGSVWIGCQTFAGGGLVSARGSKGANNHCGQGGGGRIAISYDAAAQAAEPVPTVVLTARPGGELSANADNNTLRGDFGTVWLPDARLLDADPVTNLTGKIWGVSRLARTSWTLEKTWVRFCEPGFELDITNGLMVTGAGAMLQVGGGTEQVFDPSNGVVQADIRYRTGWDNTYCPAVAGSGDAPAIRVSGGDLVLADGGALALFCAPTNGLAVNDPGATVDVSGVLVIGSGSALYPYSHPTNGASVRIRAGGVTVAAGGSINAVCKGFAGSWGRKGAIIDPRPGFGPGAPPGSDYYGLYVRGASYGGVGGNRYGDLVLGPPAYGLPAAPLYPGSAAYHRNATGGGLVWLEVTGPVVFNGEVRVDGRWTRGNDGNGSGGAVFIQCQTFAATNALFNAVGGDHCQHCGPGGGGRVAVVWEPSEQPESVIVGLRADVRGGYNTSSGRIGGPGTIFFTDWEWLPRPTLSGLWGRLQGITNLTADALFVTDAHVRLAGEGVLLAVAGDLAIAANGHLEVGGAAEPSDKSVWSPHPLASDSVRVRTYPRNAAERPQVSVGGDLKLLPGGAFSVYSAPSPLVGTREGFGAQVDVAGAITVASNAWIHPYSHPTNGASPRFVARSVHIAAGGGFDASMRGYGGLVWTAGQNEYGFGPGGARRYNGYYIAGAGHGSTGGMSHTSYKVPGGSAYGDPQAPLRPGSGGSVGRSGGGLVWLQVERALELAGTLSADAMGVGLGLAYKGTFTANMGNGSAGGAIFVECSRFEGAPTAVLSATGSDSANDECGASAGGRIAIWRRQGAEIPASAAAGSVKPTDPTAAYHVAGDGTVFWGILPAPGTTLLVR